MFYFLMDVLANHGAFLVFKYNLQILWYLNDQNLPLKTIFIILNLRTKESTSMDILANYIKYFIFNIILIEVSLRSYHEGLLISYDLKLLRLNSSNYFCNSKFVNKIIGNKIKTFDLLKISLLNSLKYSFTSICYDENFKTKA